MRIHGKPLEQWEAEFPILTSLRQARECAWINPHRMPAAQAIRACPVTLADVLDASSRLDRFADYFMAAFPETRAYGGRLESPLVPIDAMQRRLERACGAPIPGRMLLKLDSHLPISGSIKARGGIYEVLSFAEETALANGLLRPGDPYRRFDSPAFRACFSRYAIAVGSTGNLGLSIGVMSARLGFSATVHMSADARAWKKDMLRSHGVRVIEYASDYSVAVAEGRRQAQGDPMCHFVDDENSRTLFLGYAVAALRLKAQLEAAGIPVDAEHPLLVYLPCGVGGGPGGVAFGIKQVFGDAAHCFFAEPTHACCMLLGMATGLHSGISVQDLGLDNRTVADGLAVGRASGFVGRLMTPFMSGCYTLSDQRMLRLLAQLAETQNILLEPSALAGMQGPALLAPGGALSAYPQAAGIPREAMQRATHIVWATGGGMVPSGELDAYVRSGRSL